jgi:hypothetical protein
LGRLFFDFSASPRCRATVIGQIPFKGKGLILANHIAG